MCCGGEGVSERWVLVLWMVAVFDRLVEMIPANIYVAKENPTDQWVSGVRQCGRAMVFCV